jgi:drug/metabolite transporter (DMT)-like permease
VLEFVFALVGVLLIAVSQLLFKGVAKRDLGAVATLAEPKVIAGLAINVVAACCWVFALRRLELNYAFPLLSLNYLLVPLGARWCFGERITRSRWIAIAVIGIGVMVCVLAK